MSNRAAIRPQETSVPLGRSPQLGKHMAGMSVWLEKRLPFLKVEAAPGLGEWLVGGGQAAPFAGAVTVGGGPGQACPLLCGCQSLPITCGPSFPSTYPPELPDQSISCLANTVCSGPFTGL